MSLLKLDGHVDDIQFTHRGITLIIAGIPDMHAHAMRRVEATARISGKPDEYEKLDAESKDKVDAYAMLESIVVGIAADTKVNGIAIDFDTPSESAEYGTLLEELLAVNPDLAKVAWQKGAMQSYNLPEYKNVGEIAGNLSTPSSSTEELAKSPDVVV